MAKRRRKSSRQHSPPASPKELGLQAFRRNDYTEAIRQWSRLDAEQIDAIHPALAEAYFRRALTMRHQPTDAVADMRRATGLRLGEACYWYHLGLSLHRADQVDAALAAYSRAEKCGFQRQGFGFTRGLAEIEQDPHLSLDALPYLSPDDRAALMPIAALLRNEPDTVSGVTVNGPSQQKPDRTDTSMSLWQGLGHLACGDMAEALAALSLPKGQRIRAGAEAVRVLYHGLAAVAIGNTQMALAEWTGAVRASSKTALLSRLSEGIAHLHARSLSDLHATGQWAKLLKQAQTALTRAPDDVSLLRFSLIAVNRLATAAITEGAWAKALTHWQTMRDILESHPSLGPIPPVLRNLAIGYETLEQWESAAETWVALLSTLPRRVSKKTAIGQTEEDISVQQQRDWLRRRILEDYQHAGRPDQAIAYYKQAIKAAPDDLDLRLDLVSALLENDQTIAARNELHRILDRDPNHLDACLMLAEVHQMRDDEDATEQSLRRVLEIDPEHDDARHALARMLLSRGMDEFNEGEYKQARTICREALSYAPADSRLLVFLAETEFMLRKTKTARAYLEDALAIGVPTAYVHVFTCWVKQRDEQEARKVITRAETEDIATPSFYVDIGIACFNYDTPLSPMFGLFGLSRRRERSGSVWEQWGNEFIQKGLANAPDRASLLHHIVDTIEMERPEIAIDYAYQLVEEAPQDPLAFMSLGVLQATTDDMDKARKTFRDAERMARKQGQKDQAREIAEVRRRVTSLEMLKSLRSEFGDDFWEDE